jgi:hypothetical protein
MMLFSRTQGPGALQEIQLYYLAVCRQVHHLLIPLKYFYQITCKVIYITATFKVKGCVLEINMMQWFQPEWLLP